MSDPVCSYDEWILCWFSDLGFAGFADLLHILSFVPRDLNFVNHTSYIGWREYANWSFGLRVSLVFLWLL